MVATSGDRLLRTDAVQALRRELFPRALLITPNLPEASALLETAPARTEAEMQAQGERLLAVGAKAVLIKGGHGAGAEAVDLLIDSSGTMPASAAGRMMMCPPERPLPT